MITLALCAAGASATLRGTDDVNGVAPNAASGIIDAADFVEDDGFFRRLAKKLTFKQRQALAARKRQKATKKPKGPQAFNANWGKRNTFKKRLAPSCCDRSGDDVTTYSWAEFAALPAPSAAIAAGKPVTVQCGQKVLVDQELIEVKGLFVEGDLEFVDGIDITLKANYILNCGRFAIGSEEAAHQSKATIVLTGDWASGGEAGELVWRNQSFGKAPFVTYGGLTYLRGASSETTTWTKLAANARAGDTELKVRTVGEAWKVGERLLVVGTGREYDHSEIETRVIKAIDAETRTVTLNGPLKHAHLGCEDGEAMAAQNAKSLAEGKIMQGFGEKCIMAGEVASLDRNIKITSPIACARGNFVDTWGHTHHKMHKKSKQPQCGHFILSHTNIGRVSGVAFVNLGQKVTKGKYPLHVHMAGKAPTLRVEDNVVHHSHNRGIVLHAVKDASFKRNTVYYTQGHSFLLEDGVETGNLIQENLAVKPHSVNWGCKSSHDQTFKCGDRTDNTVAGFWFGNVANKFIGNVAVTHGRGFAIEARNVQGDTRLQFEPEAKKVGMHFKHSQKMMDFRDNEVHGCLWGFFNYPQLNVVQGSRGYEGLIGWKNHIAIHIKNQRNFPVHGAMLLENARAITSHTPATRISMYDSKIAAARKGAMAFGVGRWGGAGNPNALDKQYVEIDEYTRTYAYCLGGFGKNPSYHGYYLMGGRPIGTFMDVMREPRCAAFRAEMGIEFEPDEPEPPVECEGEECCEGEDCDDEDDDEPKLIDIVHTWGKKKLQKLLRSWKLHPRGSQKVLANRVIKVLNNRPNLTWKGAQKLSELKGGNWEAEFPTVSDNSEDE